MSDWEILAAFALFIVALPVAWLIFGFVVMPIIMIPFALYAYIREACQAPDPNPEETRRLYWERAFAQEDRQIAKRMVTPFLRNMTAQQRYQWANRIGPYANI